MDFWTQTASGTLKSAGLPAPRPPDHCRTGRTGNPPEPIPAFRRYRTRLTQDPHPMTSLPHTHIFYNSPLA